MPLADRSKLIKILNFIVFNNKFEYAKRNELRKFCDDLIYS